MAVKQTSRERRLLARFQELQAHVDQFDLRHRPLLDALWKFEQRVFAALYVVAAFEARSRGAEHHARVRVVRADDRHIAAVVSRRVLLLVAAIVLLVNDDESEILHRREDAGTRSHHHAREPFADAAPLLGALSVMKSGVENRDAVAESMIELAGHRGRQCDLGHEQERVASACERRLDGIADTPRSFPSQ